MQDAAFDSRAYRDTMGQFCTGVAIVTGNDGGDLVGFAAQSFVSLSLEPPLIAVCPAKTSTSWPRIRALGCFAINVLAADQQAISDVFAQAGMAAEMRYCGRPGRPAHRSSKVRLPMWNAPSMPSTTLAITRSSSAACRASTFCGRKHDRCCTSGVATALSSTTRAGGRGCAPSTDNPRGPNPFVPGWGRLPPYLAGRSDEQRKLLELFAYLQHGEATRGSRKKRAEACESRGTDGI